MKKNLILIVSLMFLVLTITISFGLQAPHNQPLGFACGDCHTGGYPPDFPVTDSDCITCHTTDANAPMIAPAVVTHSSAETSTKYGNWSTVCGDCHWVHQQEQRSTYGSATNIATGVITGPIIEYTDGTTTFGYSTLVMTRPGYTDVTTWGAKSGSERGLIIHPNPTDPDVSFEIQSVAATTSTTGTITVKGLVSAYNPMFYPGGAVPVGGTFTLQYGQNVGSVVNYPTTMNPAGYVPVRFFDKSGPNSFAHSDGISPNTDSTPDGICQVCHDQTTHWRRDGSLAAVGVHATQNGTQCTVCHKHTDGFSASGACDACHGNPPVVNTPGGPDGLVSSENGTGSTSSGAHAKHATTGGLNYPCATCHTGGMPASSIYDKILQIGFSAGGNYDGRTALANGYLYTANVTNGGSQSCSNLYCHSIGQRQGGAPLVAGSTDYKRPVWTGSVQCGSCHAGDGVQGDQSLMSSGSHGTHVDGSLDKACSECHNNAGSGSDKHANNIIEISFKNASLLSGGSYSQSPNAPGNGYGTCSSVYCHSTVQNDGGTALVAGSVSYKTPSWGGTALCGSCHAVNMQTGSHIAHLATSADCLACHNHSGPGTTLHADGNIDIAFNGSGSGSYSQNPNPPGNGYGTCSATSCHANVYGAGSTITPVWGSTGSGCSSCHSIAIAASGPNTGSHAKHNVTDCSQCHAGATNNTTSPTLNHGDGNIDVTGGYPANKAKGSAFAACSAASCHDNGRGVPAATPVWGTAAPACSACHAAAPATGSHTKHLSGLSSMFVANATCGNCHDGAVQGGPANAGHLDGNIDVYDVTSGDLGYPQNKAKGSAFASCTTSYCHSNGPKANFASATWGTTSTGCNFCHGFPPATSMHAGQTGTTCINCHTHINATGTGFTDPAKHGNHVVEGGDCLGCHSIQQGNRAAVVGQFSSNSHHIQGVTLTNAHCYQCHWEANVDGSMTAYHGGPSAPGSPVNLVIYGAGTRPTTYTVGTTAVEYKTGGDSTTTTSSSPIAVVNAWTKLTTSGSGSSRTASFTAGAGTNRMVLIGVGWEHSQSSGCNPSSITGTYGGKTITTINEANTSNNRVGQWMGYVNEAAIASKSNNTITLTFSGCTPDRTPTISAATYQGVDQSSAPVSVIASGTSGSSFSWSNLAVVKDGYAMYNLTADGISSFTPPSGYTERYDASTSNFRMTAGDRAITADGTESRTVTGNTSSSRWALVAVSVKPAIVNSTVDNTRTEMLKINQHCLGCHSAKNDAASPFGDGKTPKQYAWDNTSIDARYSQTGTTPWGKYSGANVTPKNTQTKAFSAHGNAAANKRGWNTSETWPDTSDGVNVLCYDCHNSHGSSAGSATAKTTSYTTATTNGGLLKDITSGQGGYTMSYKPTAGGSVADHNTYNPGAGLCFDCHMTATPGTKPWGYQDTFKATQIIMGYDDTPYFGAGTNGAQQRYPYKASAGQNKGGHFGASASMATPVNGTIGGLCTPCHDPHGVSTTLGANQQYAVPILKGTWMTSPYKEDAAPLITNAQRGCNGKKCNSALFSNSSTPGYSIDQNTLSTTWNWSSTTKVSQTVEQFGGLCTKCHPKTSINPSTSATWKSTSRIHNTVKGWGGSGANANNAVHSYTCSKCHAPHNSALNRLMVTNCLDFKHRGQVASGGPTPPNQSGSGEEGRGNGRFPAGGGGIAYKNDGRSTLQGPFFFGTTSGGRACHDNTNSNSYPSNQLWNNVTIWGDSTPPPAACSTYTSQSTCQSNNCTWDSRNRRCR